MSKLSFSIQSFSDPIYWGARKITNLSSTDSRSPVWTPYRTYDRLQEIQQQDPSLLSLKPQQPYASSQDTLIPKTPYQMYTTPPNALPQSVQDPFSVTDPQGAIPGRAHPVRPNQSDAFQMHPITDASGNPNVSDFNQRDFVDAGVDEPAASIVQSIKDTLAEMAGKRKSSRNIEESNCWVLYWIVHALRVDKGVTSLRKLRWALYHFGFANVGISASINSMLSRLRDGYLGTTLMSQHALGQRWRWMHNSHW